MSKLEFYSSDYIVKQTEKFRNRHSNHWRNHIKLAKDLIGEYGVKPPAKMLDLGCSIGTFAIECSLMGYESFGLDFEEMSLRQAKSLSEELGCSPSWICADAQKFSVTHSFDMVLCFDLLEHLTDSIIGRALSCVFQCLKPGGVFIFHTFPTTYDHIFYEGKYRCLPLIPFMSCKPQLFRKMTERYVRFLDIFYRIRYGKTHFELIADTVHPNPLTKERVLLFFKEAGFETMLVESVLDQISPLKKGQGEVAKRYFSHQEEAQRSIYGVFRKPA